MSTETVELGLDSERRMFFVEALDHYLEALAEDESTALRNRLLAPLMDSRTVKAARLQEIASNIAGIRTVVDAGGGLDRDCRAILMGIGEWHLNKVEKAIGAYRNEGTRLAARVKALTDAVAERRKWLVAGVFSDVPLKKTDLA